MNTFFKIFFEKLIFEFYLI